jgi:5-hydroxyisourate hydrolase
MSSISSHVLDTTLGRPAAGLAVRLEHLDDAGHWHLLSVHATNAQGRVAELSQGLTLVPGVYRLIFDTGVYLASTHAQSAPFYPEVTVQFAITEPHEHYHIPLLLSPFGYSTYRGS